MTIQASSQSHGQRAVGYHREVVASFSSYVEAERAVDFLAERSLPVDRVSVVGHGLQLSRGDAGSSTNRVAEALIIGAVVGALVTLLAALLDLGVGGAAMEGSSLAFGVACGGLSALAAAVVSTGGRLPGSQTRVLADRYDVTADPSVATELARAIDDGQQEAAAR